MSPTNAEQHVPSNHTTYIPTANSNLNSNQTPSLFLKRYYNPSPKPNPPTCFKAPPISHKHTSPFLIPLNAQYMGLSSTHLLTPLLLLFLSISHDTVSASTKPKTFQAQYGPFNSTYYNIFAIQSPAAINNDALQVTPDSAGNFTLFNRSGRVFLNQTFKLWNDPAASSVASFNTSFLINIFRLNYSDPGEGLAFVIAPDNEIPPGSDGQYIGLTNSTTDGNTTNQLVAIEFDTFKQDFDPDDNHIGLNINGVVSKKTVSLTPLGIELVPVEAALYNVWIEYNGVGKSIEVYIVNGSSNGPTPSRPAKPVLQYDLDLKAIVNQYSYFGFAASTGNTTQLNCVLAWNLTVQYYPTKEETDWLTIVLAAGLPAVVVVVIGLMGWGYYWFYRRRRAGSDQEILGALKSLPGMPREFQFKDLKKATGNFQEKNKLGEGGFGVVYKGFLAGENLEVAVKWFSRESIKGQDDFLAELTIINRLRHRHLVPLLGKSSIEYVDFIYFL